MNLNSIQINLQLGQEILVGKKQEKARITKIEHFEKSGDIVTVSYTHLTLPTSDLE